VAGDCSVSTYADVKKGLAEKKIGIPEIEQVVKTSAGEYTGRPDLVDPKTNSDTFKNCHKYILSGTGCLYITN